MVCCVTGHRPSGLNFSRKIGDLEYMDYCLKLHDEIEYLIKYGYDVFITGMADGADIDFALTVIMFKNKYDYISLEAAIPYPIQPTKTYTEYHENRDYVLENCDNKYIISNNYYRGCMHKRNRFMVDRSDLVFAIWNGKKQGGTWDTIKYARSKGKEIRYLMLDTLDGLDTYE